MKIFGIVYILGKREKILYLFMYKNFCYEVLGDTCNRPNNYGCSPPKKETEQMTKISILT